LSRRAATLEACQLRLRPILMTSFAFILGVVPLIVSTGAGAEMRRTLGTAVFSGMLGVTLFGIFLTPVFFYVIAGFIDEPMFSSARARRIGQMIRFTLGVLTLGLFWIPTLLGRLVRPQVRQTGRRKRTAATADSETSNNGLLPGDTMTVALTDSNGSNGHVSFDDESAADSDRPDAPATANESGE
jgi:multidrug efflux pump